MAKPPAFRGAPKPAMGNPAKSGWWVNGARINKPLDVERVDLSADEFPRLSALFGGGEQCSASTLNACVRNPRVLRCHICRGIFTLDGVHRLDESGEVIRDR